MDVPAQDLLVFTIALGNYLEDEAYTEGLEVELGLKVQLEFYRVADFTEHVHAYLEESSEVVYESHPARR